MTDEKGGEMVQAWKPIPVKCKGCGLSYDVPFYTLEKILNGSIPQLCDGCEDKNHNQAMNDIFTLDKDSKKIQDALLALRDNYEMINQTLRFYLDLRDEYYPLISLWIIGTYFHDSFPSYPFLYLNAQKGSGKSKSLKLISSLSKNGKLINNISEAVLFRTAKNSSLCIDEFESVGDKHQATIRELLNSAYKKGMAVERMKKVNERGEEKQVVERFDLYCPVVMANIWGMDDVLGDRCISLILERSQNAAISKLVEDFDNNETIQNIKANFFSVVSVVMQLFSGKKYLYKWNNYIRKKYETTLNYIHTYTTQNNITPLEEREIELFNKIDEAGLDGRNLELFLPLFLIAIEIGDDTLNTILEIAKMIIKEKKIEEYAESKDVALIDFVAKQSIFISYRPIKAITTDFKSFIQEEATDPYQITYKWVGRAVKRLGLVLKKRRTGAGIEVMLNVNKAKEKIKNFKVEEVEEHA